MTKTDPAGRTTAFAYSPAPAEARDGAGNLSSVTGPDPDGGGLWFEMQGPCPMPCLSIMGVAGGGGGGGGRGAGSGARATSSNETRAVHRNSLDYVGETHVYAIRGPEGLYKIGQSAQGTRVRDGASIRGERQARRRFRETDDAYLSEIRKSFPDKRSAVEYETRLIERIRSRYPGSLPGNKVDR